MDNGNQCEAHDASDSYDVGDCNDGIALLVKEIYVLVKHQVVVPHNQP